jgi:protein AbiQ
MDEYKIYSITDEYINYLRVAEPNVYSNKQDNRTHTRKYIGTVLEINNMKYFIPMSSPKDSDYQKAGNSLVIKKSIVPIIRIIEKSNGIKQLKGTLRISHMIPVPESELELYDLDNELDTDYKKIGSCGMI